MEAFDLAFFFHADNLNLFPKALKVPTLMCRKWSPVSDSRPFEVIVCRMALAIELYLISTTTNDHRLRKVLWRIRSIRV